METAVIHVPDPEHIAETRLRGPALIVATRRAKPALKAALKIIDEEFATCSRTDRDETRCLAKVAAYRKWLVRHGLHPSVIAGCPHIVGIMRELGEGETEITDTVRAAIRDLADLLPPDGSTLTRLVKDPTDLLIDLHETRMRDRGYGLSRNASTTRICWRSTAQEIGCKHSDLTRMRMERLRAIDKQIDVPGPIVGHPQSNWRTAPANPAVAPLLAAALERLKGCMPSDPLLPHMIDYIVVAEEAGVSVDDILLGPDAGRNRLDMEAARDGKPLVPHPLLAERRFTYSQMKEAGRQARVAEATKDKLDDPFGAGRARVRALNQFLSLEKLGGTIGENVPYDFPGRVKRAIAEPHSFGSGFASHMRAWVEQFKAIRSAAPLPDTFATALRILAAEAGTTQNGIVKVIGRRALPWLHGRNFPSHQSEPLLRKLDDHLLVRQGTIKRVLADEWRLNKLDISLKKLGLAGVGPNLPPGLSELSIAEQEEVATRLWRRFKRQETVFSRRLSKAVRDRYRLAFDDWPKALRQAWLSQIPKIGRGMKMRNDVSLRTPGDRPSKAERSNRKAEEDRSWTGDTKEMGEYLIGFYLGYLRRGRDENGSSANSAAATGPRPATDRTLPSDQVFAPGPGLGIPSELLHPVLFAVVDLAAGYAHWKKGRSGGRFAPTTSYTMRHMAEFLKPETGLVWRNPGWLLHLEAFAKWWDQNETALPGGGRLVLDIDAFRENWREAVGQAYEIAIADASELKQTDPTAPKNRDPFLPVQGYLDEDDPLAAYMVDMRRMIRSKPMSMIDRHNHRRNSILGLIAVQTGLRAGTLLFTISGEEPTLRREIKDGVLRWRVVIPAAHFKNWYSPYFSGDHPYEQVLDDEDGLYEMLDAYMATTRPYFLRGRESDAFFITSKGRDFTADTLGNCYRNLTGRFFVKAEGADTGVTNVLPHGLHAIRHVIATSLLKTTGDIYQAAYAIQDSTRTVERHYARFLPRDKAKLARDQMRASRAAA